MNFSVEVSELQPRESHCKALLTCSSCSFVVDFFLCASANTMFYFCSSKGAVRDEENIATSDDSALAKTSSSSRPRYKVRFRYRNISCIMRIFFFNFAAQTRGAHYKLVLTKSSFSPECLWRILKHERFLVIDTAFPSGASHLHRLIG